MRFGRTSPVHVLIIAIVLAVAVAGVTTNHFGIDRAHSGETSLSFDAAPVPAARQNQLLVTAHALRQQGRYEEAIAKLKPVIASANSSTAGLALLETAKNEIALGNLKPAMDALRTLLRRYPRSPQADEAQFQLGQVEAAQGNLVAALRDLQNYRKRHPNIAPYVDLIVVGYEEQRGDLAKALALVRTVASSPIAPRTKIEALERAREIQLKQKDYAGYLGTTDGLLAIATIASYRAELLYERATTEINLDRKDAAIADMRTVIDKYPDSAYAAKALEELGHLASPSTVTDLQRGLVDYYSGKYQPAAQAFTSGLATNPDSDSAWYYRAMSVLKNGNSQDAAIQLSVMVDRFPSSPLTPHALFTAAKIRDEDGDLDAAESMYTSIIGKYPQTVDATNARLRLGIVFYQTGDYPGALAILAPVHGGSATQAQASYWEGKAYQQRGETEKAVAAWKNAALADPNGFYGLLANQMLAGRLSKIPSHPDPAIDTSMTQQDQVELANWYVRNGTNADEARAAVQQDSAFKRLDQLFELGLSTEAGWELSSLADRYTNDPSRLAVLGELLNEAGRYNAAYRVGIRLQTIAEDNGSQLPRALERLAYPIAYPALVQEQASADTIDPLLLLALMRQESAYDPTATSPADARGLTQVIPNTAAEIATELHVDNWSADKLYRPVIAIQFGARFLSDRLRKYGGQVFPALAGYNAGDGNVAEWMSKDRASDPDLFMERIPFPETYDYVRIVYANYLNYLRLYR